MKIIKPAKLNIGDTIGIVASSLPVLPSFKENYEKGKKVLTDLGFKIKEGQTIGKIRWWAAGTPKEVAEDINAMFADKSVKAIMAQTGGYSAISAIEHLDYELITHNPKPFLGMSDMTAYHLAIFVKTGMAGFHMDDVTFGLGGYIKSAESLKRFLMGNSIPGRIEPLTKWEDWKTGKVTGQLIGGNLYTLCSLIGTPYFPKIEQFEKAIFFWEEVGSPLNEIAQMLYELKYLGIFDSIAGMLIGKIQYIKPMREKEIVTPTLKEMVLDILKDYKFPILAEVDFGHFTVNIPMPIGIKVSFDTSKKELNFLESAVT